MVYSIPENEKRHSNRLKSTNEVTPRRSLKYKNKDEISSKDTSKKDTTKPVIMNLYSPIIYEIINLNMYRFCQVSFSKQIIDHYTNSWRYIKSIFLRFILDFNLIKETIGLTKTCFFVGQL